MSIKNQKILRFIPFVNFITMFFWIGMCFNKAVRWFDFFKELVKMFAACFIITFTRGIGAYFIQSEIGNRIAFFVCACLCFFAISCISVGAQERIIKRDKEK